MNPRPSAVVLTVLAIAIIVIPFGFRLSLLEVRGYNPDEFEHLHFSWCIAKGMVPYLDYFDHHTPWLHFFFSLLIPFFDVERLPDEALGFISMARRWMWLFSASALALTFGLGKLWRDGRTALVATLFLANSAVFLSKTLEIRPSVPALGLLVAAVLATLVAVRRASRGAPGAAWRFFAGGLMLGSATMLTQKILFVGPGFAVATCWLLLDRRLEIPLQARVRFVAGQVLGYCLPIAFTAAYFASRGALWQFIDLNLFINARWPKVVASGFLIELLRQDTFFLLLATSGFIVGLKRAFEREGARRGEPVLALSMLSFVVTIPVHPLMSFQHLLLLMPFASLYAAAAVIGVSDAVTGWCERRDRSWKGGLQVVGVALATGIVSYVIFSLLSHAVDTAPFVLPFAVAMLLALPFLLRAGERNLVLTVALVLLSIQPLHRLRATFNRGNWSTIQGISYVLRNTTPWETTFDGFTGLGLFRHQAFYHHFQEPHVFLLQSDREHREMLAAFRAGRVMPKLIFWSHYLRNAVTPELAAFLGEHYVPTGLEPIRVRPFDNGLGWWSDEATRYLGWEEGQERTPHVLFEHGWRPPSAEDGVSVRRTRTRKSKLIVPIRHPREYAVVFRARADKQAGPFAVELVVNGKTAGVREAAPRWQDYEFRASRNQLRPGFNEFELRFSAENDTEDRRLELAVHSLKLTSVPPVPVAEGERDSAS
jgi:hypothetical protein